MDNLLDACWSVIIWTSTFSFHIPKHGVELNKLWLVTLHVTHGRFLDNESCNGVQTFCIQSKV